MQTMPVSLDHFLVLALLMFGIGAFGVMFRRNLLMVLMSIELMLNACNIVFVAGSRFHSGMDGQIMVFIVMMVAACEAAVGLAMVIALFRRYGTIRTEFLRVLRG